MMVHQPLLVCPQLEQEAPEGRWHCVMLILLCPLHGAGQVH